MRMYIILFILCFLSNIGYSQARLALAANYNYNDLYLYKNSAIISKIILEQKGELWYENLMTQFSPKQLSHVITVNMCGDLILSAKSAMPSDIKNVLQYLIKYIENNQIVIYGNWGFYDIFMREHDYVTPIDLCNIISQEGRSKWNVFVVIANGWFFYLPGNQNFNYEFYIENEKRAGRKPKSHIEWIKAKIDYYLSLPIESSLDYGITNEDFCPQRGQKMGNGQNK